MNPMIAIYMYLCILPSTANKAIELSMAGMSIFIYNNCRGWKQTELNKANDETFLCLLSLLVNIN